MNEIKRSFMSFLMTNDNCGRTVKSNKNKKLFYFEIILLKLFPPYILGRSDLCLTIPLYRDDGKHVHMASG